MVVAEGEHRISTSVNGDTSYDARTTRRAVGLLMSDNMDHFGEVSIYQKVGTPIGSGFGASAASATSAVYAVSKAAGIRKKRKDLATYAYDAEIAEQTGLGTVSVVYDAVGAGAITRGGAPGRAKFLTVPVPRDLRIVTAFIAPYDKKEALSSTKLSERINRLGSSALQSYCSDPSLDTLAAEGERFSRLLGLESPEVKKLIEVAKSAGASRASQNMIGHAIHSLTYGTDARRVAEALKDFSKEIRVDIYEVGSRRAGLVDTSRR